VVGSGGAVAIEDAGSSFAVDGGNFDNQGRVDIGVAGTTLLVSGTYTAEAGSITTLQGGELSASGGIIGDGAFIGGTGIIDPPGTVTLNGTTLDVGEGPGALTIHGNIAMTGGEIIFHIDPDGKGSFLESTLVLDPGHDVSLDDIKIKF